MLFIYIYLQYICHPEQSEGSAVAFVVAFLSVIPLRGICFCYCLLSCHPEQGEGSAFAFALAVVLAFLSVIPAGNLLFARATTTAGCPIHSAHFAEWVGTTKA